VDAAIISHGHYDHGGGLETFLKTNSHAPVYVNKNAFGRYYSKNGYIGLTEDFSQNERVILTDNEQEIFPFAKLMSGENFEITEDNYALGLEMETEFHEREKDSFIHEQYLLIEEKGKRILISGCSHRGILNIMNYFKPHVFVGGFHLFSLDADSKEMEYVSKKLSEYDTTFYTCHCTGMEQYGALKSVLKEKLKYISCGKKFDL
jgi:7,8-dihydropterin-6-yl-methyl-4-(beta-D-ribofuranosyl)aminobenzene 5'-phosphate synthase